MKKRVITSSFIFVVILSMFLLRLATNYVFDVLIGFLTISACFEISQVYNKGKKPNFTSIVSCFPLVIYIGLLIGLNFERNYLYFLTYFIAIILLIFLAMFIVGLLDNKGRKDGIKSLGITVSKSQFAFIKSMNSITIFFYPCLLLCSLFFINHLAEFELFKSMYLSEPGFNLFVWFALMLVFVITILTDVFAYLLGNFIGGRKLCPKISPNKTYSGALGGFLFGAFGAYLLYKIFALNLQFLQFYTAIGGTIGYVILIGLVGTLLCQIGDMIASLIKRQALVKDYGTIFPGHGGVMDRVDGMTFVSFSTMFFIIALLI